MPPTYTYGQDVKDNTGKVIGQAKFDTATGKPLAAPNTPQTPSATVGGYTVPTYYNPPSTTTISNVNKVNQVPGMINALDKISDRGVRTETNTGVATYADGTPAESPEIVQGRKDALANIEKQRADAAKRQQDALAGITTKPSTTPIKSELDLEGEAVALKQDQMLADMKANLDAETKALIDNIQQNFQRKREEQTKINEKQNKGIQAGLLTGGVTGKGSRAQYASISSGTNIMAAQENYALDNLKKIDEDERAAIAAAKAAQASGDFKILGEQLMLAEKRHNQKLAAAAELNKKVAEDNAKLQERNMQVERETAITDLYSEGLTDTASIMGELRNMGVDVTSKEVTETLKNLVPAGVDDLVKTLRTNGAPQEVIQGVLKSTNINDAYNKAGNWAAGGTGIVGEYNLYKAQAMQAGQVPMSFNDYQDVDANRKRSIAKAGAASSSGLPNNVISQIDKISSSFDSAPIVKQYNEVLNKKLSVDGILNSGVVGPGDLALVFEFMKALDPTSVVRETEYDNASKSGNIFLGAAAKFNGYMKPGGGFLPEGVRKDFQKLIDTKLNVATKQYDNFKKENARKINMKTGAQDGEDYLTNYEGALGTNVAKDLVQTEDQAKQSVLNYGKNNPSFQPIIMKKVNEVNPYTKQKYTYSELLQIYPEMSK